MEQNEQIIDKVLNSLNGMRRAEMSEQVYERIISASHQKRDASVIPMWVFATAASVLLVVNVVSLRNMMQSEGKEKVNASSQDNYELVQNITYTYE